MISIASNALTTLDTLKTELGISGSDEDGHLSFLVNVASAAIESALLRDLRLQSETELLSGVGRQRLNLRRYPVKEVTSLKIDGVDVTDFVVLGEIGQVYRRDGFPLQAAPYRRSAPQTVGGLPFGPPTYDFTADTDPRTADLNVEVTYLGGYVLPNDDGDRTLPWDIEGSCVRLCVDMHKRDPGIVNERAAGGTQFQVDAQLLEQEIKRLRRYKRLV